MQTDRGVWTAPSDVRQRATSLLCDLVAIPSYGGEDDHIIQYLVDRFRQRNIPCRVTELDGKPINVLAELGAGPRAIVLNSHHDTVPPGDRALWSTDPFTPVELDGKIYGRGAEDAKGCLAAMIVAFEALAERREALPARVMLMAVGEEERGGLGTKTEAMSGLRADAAIVGESTQLVPMIAHKGVLRLEVEVVGKAAHASEPEAGVNAIAAMAPVISALDTLGAEVRRRTERHTGNASLVIATIAGGTALNVIPARCVISVDRRVLPNETEAEAMREIAEAVHPALPAGSGARLEVRQVRFVPPAITDPAAPIVAAAEEAASAVLGRSVRAAGFTATCDMTYLVNVAKIPTVILGPDSIALAHQANECISIEQMALAVEIYLKTLEAWARRT